MPTASPGLPRHGPGGLGAHQLVLDAAVQMTPFVPRPVPLPPTPRQTHFSPFWQVFVPDSVADPAAGALAGLELDLASFGLDLESLPWQHLRLNPMLWLRQQRQAWHQIQQRWRWHLHVDLASQTSQHLAMGRTAQFVEERSCPSTCRPRSSKCSQGCHRLMMTHRFRVALPGS